MQSIYQIQLISKTFSDVNCTNVFLGQPPKAIKIKAKINRWDLIKLTSFCTAKETINQMKRQPTNWEKIFASDATNKGSLEEATSETYESSRSRSEDRRPWQRS